jgi:DNA-binding CsgD family transcriptional regulator
MAGLFKPATFVGRKQEIAMLIELLTQVEQTGGPLVLISGEAGVGKTTLLREVSRRAQSVGWLTLTSHAFEAEGAPPYLLFSDVLGEYAATLGPQRLEGLLGENGVELTRMLPGLLTEAPGRVYEATSSPLSERFRFFEAISDFVTNLARSQPKGLLIGLDDLDRAEESSLLLLQHLARRAKGQPVLMVATFRTLGSSANTALARTLQVLRREGASVEVQLAPLDRQNVGELLAALGEADPPARIVNAFHEHTDGNPLFVKELLKTLAAQGRLFDGAGGWRTEVSFPEGAAPRTVRELLDSELRALSQGCRQALTAAAILGRSFDFPLLSQMCDLAPDDLLHALDEATRVRLIEEDDSALRFSHALIRQTLLGELSAPRRQTLHLRAAESIEQLAEGDVEGHLGELARHYQLAGSLASSTKVRHFAAQAADQAVRVFAYEEALRLYDAALVGGKAIDGLAGDVDLRFRRGEVLLSLGRWKEAKSDFESIVDHVALKRRAEVLVYLALSSDWMDDMSSAKSYGQAARRLVDEQRIADLQPAVESIDAYVDLDKGDLASAIEHFRSSAQGPDQRQPGSYRWLGNFPVALYWTGHIQESIERSRAEIAIARSWGDLPVVTNLTASFGLALAAAARYREAANVFAEALDLAHQLQWPGLFVISKSTGFHVDTYDFKGAKLLAQQAHEPAGGGLAPTGSARPVDPGGGATVSSGIDLLQIAARTGDLTGADTLLKAVSREAHEAAGRHGWLWQLRLAEVMAEIALARHSWQLALEKADTALQLSRLRLRPKYEALSLTARGNALVALGRKREGLSDLRSAVEVGRPVGDPAMLLRAASAVLAVDGDDSILAEAGRAIERIAANLPDEMIEPFEAAEPVRLVFRLQDQSPPSPAGLSRREMEVLELIAEGKSNRQIAEQLILSHHTVANHVRSILAKAGLSNRAGAAAFATFHGLGPKR